MVKEYSYNVNEEINGLKIVKQMVNKHKQKTYEVQSLEYPSAPTYIIAEYSLINGCGDAYLNGKRVFEGNSIYSVEHARDYIINIEEAKTIHEGSRKTLELSCKECGFSKNVQARIARDNGFNCLCKSSISYPELFMLSYIEVKKLNFEYQAVLKNSLRRFDFYDDENSLAIEMHGEQHYNKCSEWYKSAKEQDKFKKEYCEQNNIKLIEINSSVSKFEFIENSIKDSELENITHKEKMKMIEIINKNKRYPVKEIVKYYESGLDVKEIAENLKISEHVVYKVLRMNNVAYRKRGKKVKCVETNQIFDSLADANEWCGLKRDSSKIQEYIKEDYGRKSAGKHPITKEKLHWE